MNQKIKAAFFDRDGTLIKDVNYLKSLDNIELIPNILDLCSYLQDRGYKLFVITNQSGISRKYFDEQFVLDTHLYLKWLFGKHNVFFEKFYHCPHQDIHNCECRKPKPGLILKACQEFDIDLKQSLMFGDKNIDLEAGNLAGCQSFLIQDILNQDYKNILK